MYKGFAVFSETVTCDTILTHFRFVIAVFRRNSLENFGRIQLISVKFSRELSTRTTDRRE